MKKTIRKTLTFLMALWILLLSTGAFPHAFANYSKTYHLEEADFPCSGHACGCETAQACQQSCCCFPEKSEPIKSESSSCHSTQTEDTEYKGSSKQLNFFLMSSCQQGGDQDKGFPNFKIKSVSSMYLGINELFQNTGELVYENSKTKTFFAIESPPG